MKNKIICLGIILCLLTMPTVFGKITEVVQCFLVDYTIKLDGGIINRSLDNPLISYKDTTYISIRDVMKKFDKNVVWKEETETIEITANNLDEIIKNRETAMNIAKAILTENYAEKITETTKYALVSIDADHIEAEKIYELYVVFEGEDFDENNPKEIVKNADIKVTVSARNAKTSIELLK